MFGFKGTPTCFIIQEANGIVNGSNRDIASRHGSKYGGINARYIFDFDDVSGTNPNLQALLSTVLTAYDGNPKTLLPARVQIFAGGAQIGGINYSMEYTFVYTNTEIRYFRHSSSAAFSPPTRKIKTILPYHETVLVQFAHLLNSTPQATINNLVGEIDLDMRQFPNLEAVDIHESFITRVNFKFNNPKLIHFQLRETLGLTGVTGQIPSTVESIVLAQCNLTGVTTLLSEATNARALVFGLYSGLISSPAVGTTTLRGVLDVSHMTNLKEFLISTNTNMTSLVLPSGKTDWSWVHIQNLSASASSSFNMNVFEEIITNSPNLRCMVFISNNKTYSKNITHNEISSNLLAFYCYGNNWTGDISITESRSTLRDFRVGLNQSETNRFDNIDISGLDGGELRSLHIPGVLCSNITLPNTLPFIQDLVLYDNELSITTTPDLLTKINGYSSLTELSFSNNVNTASNSYFSQTSDGLGDDGDLSGLINMTTLMIGSCKIGGNWILPNVNKLQHIGVGFNTGLTNLVNFTAHTGLLSFRCNGCIQLDASIPSTFTSLTDIRAIDTQLSSLNLSGKTSTSQFTAIIIDNTPITELVMPTTEARSRFTNSHAFSGIGCTGLTTIINLENVNYNSPAVPALFHFNGCNLDMTFPFGTNNFIPTNILIQDNGINLTNVDATINNLYTNRSKWSFFNVSVARSMNIGGTNATPTGIYQAPTGFILGSNDGTPASAKEQVYVLVNNYAWTITMN